MRAYARECFRSFVRACVVVRIVCGPHKARVVAQACGGPSIGNGPVGGLMPQAVAGVVAECGGGEWWRRVVAESGGGVCLWSVVAECGCGVC